MTAIAEPDGTAAEAPGALDGLIVLEVGDALTAYAGRLLAAQGAYVLKIEPPAGAPSRAYAPFAAGADHVPGDASWSDTARDDSLHWAALNVGKHSLVLDLATGPGQARLERLLERADVLLDGSGAGALARAGLDASRLQALNPRLITTSITPFGPAGPWAGHVSTDLVSLAMSGMLNDCGYDDHTLPPIRPTGEQAYNTAGVQAVLGTLLALVWRESSGRGQVVDVSVHDACASTIEFADLYWWYWQALTQRQTARHAFPALTAPNLYRTADGRYAVGVLILHHDHVWRDIKSWLKENGLLLDLGDPEYDDPAYRRAHQHLIHDRISALAAMLPADEFYRRGQRGGWVVGTVRYPADLLRDRQLAERDFWREFPVGDRTVRFPASPVRVHGTGTALTGVPGLDDGAADVAARFGELS
jgi:crotonobetainyl-CoA:carnitine CoA-transferase CaiB-like acyl-CoA transferase